MGRLHPTAAPATTRVRPSASTARYDRLRDAVDRIDTPPPGRARRWRGSARPVPTADALAETL